MKTQALTPQEALNLLRRNKEQILTFVNTQTGRIFSYKYVRCDYDPLDYLNTEIPSWVHTHIGEDEFGYMGLMYGDCDYIHHEQEDKGTFLNDDPHVKVLRFVHKCMKLDKKMGHIEIYAGLITTSERIQTITEGEDGKPRRETVIVENNLNCSQVANGKYGCQEKALTAAVRKQAGQDFIKARKRGEMHTFVTQELKTC